MTVLIVKPNKEPILTEIENTLKTMQTIVEGHIEALYPFEDEIALVCNEEGKLLGLPLNRALYDTEGNMYEIIAGTFIVCGLGEENFDSLSPDLIEKFGKRFLNPEYFFF